VPRPWHIWYWRSLWNSWLAGKSSSQLLSVDLFDTILRRSCHPDEIKFLTARHIWLTTPEMKDLSCWEIFHERQQCEERLAEEAKIQGMDGEYRYASVLRVWLHKIYPVEKRIEIEKQVEILARAELEIEKRRIRLDSGIEQLLLKWPNKHCFIIVSDFYMPSSSVKEILDTQKFSLSKGKIYVSHDHGLSKRTGRLFEKVREEADVSPERHIHIGDLFSSDVLSQIKTGGKAYWYRGAYSERRKQNFIRKSWEKRKKKDLTSYIKIYCDQYRKILPGKGLGKKESRLFKQGMDFSLLIGPLVLFILEEAVRERVSEVWYCTREGELLAAAHEILAKENILEIELPRARLLEVSRQSTFCASLREGSLEELQSFWAVYPRHSLKSFLISLDMEVTPLLPVFERLFINLENEWDKPWENSDFIRLWNDPEFKIHLQEHAQRKRDALLTYCAEQGIVNESGKHYFVIDIGWHGGIQDNLAKVIDKVFLSGRYLGLQKFLVPQPKNTLKGAFGPDLNNSSAFADLLDYVSPLEMIFNSRQGSVRGYQVGKSGVEVLRTEELAEQNVFENFTKYFQAGILAALKVFGQVVRNHGLTSAELRSTGLEAWRRLGQHPSAEVAQAYFQLRHNELFGMGVFVDKNRRFPYGQLLASAFSRKARDRMNENLSESGWPQGFLRARRLGMLVPLYNLRQSIVRKSKR